MFNNIHIRKKAPLKIFVIILIFCGLGLAGLQAFHAYNKKRLADYASKNSCGPSTSAHLQYTDTCHAKAAYNLNNTFLCYYADYRAGCLTGVALLKLDISACKNYFFSKHEQEVCELYYTQWYPYAAADRAMANYDVVLCNEAEGNNIFNGSSWLNDQCYSKVLYRDNFSLTLNQCEAIQSDKWRQVCLDKFYTVRDVKNKSEEKQIMLIGEPKISQITSNSVVVEWKTDGPSFGSVLYGQKSPVCGKRCIGFKRVDNKDVCLPELGVYFGCNADEVYADNLYIVNHKVILENLESNAAYYFLVQLKNIHDVWNHYYTGKTEDRMNNKTKIYEFRTY